jgi:Ca2+-dependent lipid-binding protein/Ca2+-binding EF-hand superfamily protein
MAKDCTGRTCFHFACCSWSNEAIALILGLKPELVNVGDNLGRTGLHYAVWNSCDAQVDILRTIIERGGNINQVDDYGKTALHYAAEGGRARAIPILIQKGADMAIREKRTHKTALELACNDRTRELMVVYSSAPYTLKSKDKSFLDNAVKGESVVVKKQTIVSDERVIRKPGTVVESIPLDVKSSALVPEYWRGKLIGMMEQLQQIGVRSYQHVKRPYLFTGSWMEGITSIEQLYDRVRDITAAEAMLRLFNILQPYDGELPNEGKDEIATSHFYGEYYNFEIPKETKIDLSAIGNSVIEQQKIASIQQALELANKKNEDLATKISTLNSSGIETEKLIADLKARVREFEDNKLQLAALQKTVLAKGQELLQAQKERDEAKEMCNRELGNKDQALMAIQSDLQEKDIELTRAKKELASLRTQIKMFEAERTKDGSYAPNSMKIMNKFERKKYVSQDLSIEDQAAIRSLLMKLRTNPPDLGTRLRQEDKNADGLINSFEFLQALEKIQLPPDFSVALRTIAGFNQYEEIYIEDFLELINRKVAMDDQKERNLLEIFVQSFMKRRMTVEEALKGFDKNVDNSFDLGEFKQLVLDLGINLDDKSLADLFNLIDVNGSGLIDINELKSKLGALEKDNMAKSPKTAKELADQLKDKTKNSIEIAPKRKQLMGKLAALDALDDALDKNRSSFEKINEEERIKSLLEKDSKLLDSLKNNNFEPLIGDLKLQFQKIDKLKINLSDFTTLYLLIRLPGLTKNWIEKEIYPHGISAFKYAMKISAINVLEENIGKSVVLKLIGMNKQNLRVDLGSVEVPWKKCLEHPDNWAVNDTLTLEGAPNQASPCTMNVSLRWIPAGSADFKSTIYDDYYLKKGFSAPKAEEGYLQINLASALLHDCGDKVSLKLNTPDGKNYTLSPDGRVGDEYQFNKQYVCPIKCLRDDLLMAVSFSMKNDKENLGECYVNWAECLHFPKEPSENKAFLLYRDGKRTKYKVYLRMQYLTMAQTKLMGLQDKKDVANNAGSFTLGIMKVGIVRARNLPADEGGKDKGTSDPLVVIKFKNTDKVVKYSTDEIEKNLNPTWNEDISFGVKILKEGAPPPFEIEVYDHDTWSANDLLGTVKIKSNPCFESPCTWAINGFFQLTQPEKNIPGGEIYIRAYFVPDGQFDPNTNPKDVETGDEYKIKASVAKLHFRVIAGRELVYLKDGIPQPKASPYVGLFLPNNKTKTTKAISDTLNPNWYYNYMGSVDMNMSNSLLPVKCKVWHKTNMFSKDQLMSEVDVDLQRCLDNRGKWIINELVTLPGEQKFLRPNNLKDMGKLYILAKIVESSRIDDEVEPQMMIDMPKIGAGEIKGTLLINVVHCKDLPKVDSGLGGNLCDPLVKFSTKGAESVETPVIWGDLNPVYNKKLLMTYKVSGAADVAPLLVQVYDQDRMSGRDLVGSVETDLTPCFTAPGKWGINKIFNLPVEEKYRIEGEQPQVYFQVKFLPEGQIDDGEPAPLLEDLLRTVGDRKRQGTLVVKVIHARGLIRGDTGLSGSSSDPYVEMTLPPNGKKYKTKHIANTLVPHWNEEFLHQVDIPDVRYVNNAVFKVYDHDGLLVGGGDDLIGFVEVDLKPVLNDPNAWTINKLFELDGPVKLREKLKLKNFGLLYLQILYYPNGQEMTKKLPPLVEDIVQLSKDSETSGTLLVKVVHAKDLMRGDKDLFGGGASSDPMVRIKWPNGKTTDSGKRTRTVTPVWNELLQQKISVNKLNIPMLYVEVFDWDPLSNDLLGTCFVDIDDCIKNPGQWKVNQNFKLEGAPEFTKKYTKFGEIYLQVMYLEGQNAHDGNFPPVTENLQEVLDKAAVKGTLEIKLIHGANLLAGDNSGKSDPYCVMIMPDKKELKSRKINDTLNPVWKQDFSHPISLTDSVIEPIIIRVMDADTMNPDDPLGRCTVPVQELFEKPGQWLVNKIIPLEPVEAKETKEKQNLGEVYIQARFVREGMSDSTPAPALIKDLEQEIKQKRIEGTLAVVIVHCKGLQVDDPKSCKVYAEAILGDNKQSTNFANTRNPKFDQFVLRFPVSLESVDFLKPLVIKVYEKGFLSSSLIGEITVDLKDMTTQPINTWFLNKIIPINGPEKMVKKFIGKLGEIYLQCK